MIDKFADATGDHQWIHVDVERAKREMPGGKTIAHGYLTLSLLPRLAPTLLKVNKRQAGHQLRLEQDPLHQSRARRLAHPAQADHQERRGRARQRRPHHLGDGHRGRGPGAPRPGSRGCSAFNIHDAVALLVGAFCRRNATLTLPSPSPRERDSFWCSPMVRSQGASLLIPLPHRGRGPQFELSRCGEARAESMRGELLEAGLGALVGALDRVPGRLSAGLGVLPGGGRGGLDALELSD